MTVSCGVDFHARQQTVAWCDTSDGEIHLEKLDHQDHNQVRSFYARSGRGLIVGLEASGYSQWFEALLAELGHQCSRRGRDRGPPPRPLAAEKRSPRRGAHPRPPAQGRVPAGAPPDRGESGGAPATARPPPAGQDAHPGEQRALCHRPRTRAPRARRNCSRAAGASGSRRWP